MLAERDGFVQIAVHPFGQGRAAYFSGFRYRAENTRLLFRTLCWLAGCENFYGDWNSSNMLTECAFFPASKTLVIINNSDTNQTTTVGTSGGKDIKTCLAPFELQIMELDC